MRKMSRISGRAHDWPVRLSLLIWVLLIGQDKNCTQVLLKKSVDSSANALISSKLVRLQLGWAAAGLAQDKRSCCPRWIPLWRWLLPWLLGQWVISFIKVPSRFCWTLFDFCIDWQAKTGQKRRFSMRRKNDWGKRKNCIQCFPHQKFAEKGTICSAGIWKRDHWAICCRTLG